jgi:DNA-binding NarL/FixJ family response regulator
MLEAYNAQVAERAALGIPALPLTKDQTAELVKLLKSPPAGKEAELLELITNRVPAGVDDAAKVKPARWMVLYRRHDVRFSQNDAAHLHGLWTHLSRALVLNRTRHLQRKTRQNNKDAAASGLISMDGTIEIADARFYELLELEWPILSPQSLPEVVMEYLRVSKIFRGQKIEISLQQRHGFYRCRITPIKNLEVLSPREFVIARRFSTGMSHKQIARELGISHHTVRNQLAHTYRKLDVHDKLSLYDYLRMNGLNK